MVKFNVSDKNIKSVIFKLFISWKAFLIFCAVLSLWVLPLFSENFLGGGYKNYRQDPYLLSWGNFDGEHYLSIAIHGYKGLEQAFFPVYPSLISLFLKIFPNNVFFGTIFGLLISNMAFIGALFVFWKLLRIDYNEKISFGVIVTLVVFPTSFYLGSVYNESLFLLLALLSFYFARKKNWFLSGLFGAIASGTRVFGIILLPALLIEGLQQRQSLKKLLPLALVPLGLLSYMFYLWLTTNDPLAFYNLQLLVGEQHQRGIILLPQVIFRYIMILITNDPLSPIYQTVLLELLVGILFFALPIYGLFKNIRLGYIFFALVSFIVPTIQGSFSSVPRYVLAFFPSFIALYLLINKLPIAVRVALLIISIIALGLETMLFIRGYWVA